MRFIFLLFLIILTSQQLVKCINSDNDYDHDVDTGTEGDDDLSQGHQGSGDQHSQDSHDDSLNNQEFKVEVVATTTSQVAANVEDEQAVDNSNSNEDYPAIDNSDENEDGDSSESDVEVETKDESIKDEPVQPPRNLNSAKLMDVLSKPGILAGIIGGCVIGILTAILLIMFIVYRMRKKDEGSYALDADTKKPLSSYEYRNVPTKEFYA